MKKYGKKLNIIIILSLCFIGLIIFNLWYFISLNNKKEVRNKHLSNPSTLDFFETAFKFPKQKIDLSAQKIIAGIMPHHLLAADLIAEFFNNLQYKNYDTIVLLGPNHFNGGDADIIISSYDWQTPYGVLHSDKGILKRILKSGAGTDEAVMGNEHSITSEVSFIKKIFPDAEFIPIILKSDTDQQQAEVLARQLFALSQEKNILVLASVDFSHYQDSQTAQKNDKDSIAAIKNFDFNKIYNLDIDSPASIYTLLKFCQLSGADFKLLNNSNSAILADKPDLSSTTSYVTGYFLKNQDHQPIKFLFFGDIMLDRHVKEIIDKNGGVDYLMEKISGEEKRFFQGIDLMMANLEGAVTNNGAHYAPEVAIDFAFDKNDVKELGDYNFNFFTISNNHITDQGWNGFYETQQNLDELGFNYVGCQDKKVDECSVKIINLQDKKVAMLAYSMVYGSLDEDGILEQVKEARSNSDLVIVNMHWGVEYEHKARSNQVALAHDIIDAGADAIIGHHPHVVQEIEIYNNKPIFYSLGNFIFDQYFSKETQEGLAIGLTWKDNFSAAVPSGRLQLSHKEMQINLFPFYSEKSQPALMAGTQKQEFLNWLAEISDVDENYKKDISLGSLSLAQDDK